MSDNAPQPPLVSTARLWLNSFIMALAGSCGYLIVAIAGGHTPLVTVISMAAIVAVLTPIFFLLNRRRARVANPPRRP
ncbi:hypothetical protein [Microbacterium radiodurans]|uniref:Uncharacterized protein n=1 Tax=Microbacterium radiodurans TaxID=661398 RepID=A0A5J5IUU0_9MICO|nr:hypothetical protein [Microbacterium radiodurans]KAA9088951.1 hypothetical protein F6B42_00075 [Microbacterium radiodurans]